MHELFPIAAGLLVGALAAWLAPRARTWAVAVAAVVLGFAATVISGEYLVGWEFLLVDIPLVAVCATLALVVLRRLRRPDPSIRPDA
jgi:high-affinity Fe2+/Pb2+ permease